MSRNEFNNSSQVNGPVSLQFAEYLRRAALVDIHQYGSGEAQRLYEDASGYKNALISILEKEPPVGYKKYVEIDSGALETHILVSEQFPDFRIGWRSPYTASPIIPPRAVFQDFFVPIVSQVQFHLKDKTRVPSEQVMRQYTQLHVNRREEQLLFHPANEIEQRDYERFVQDNPIIVDTVCADVAMGGGDYPIRFSLRMGPYVDQQIGRSMELYLSSRLNVPTNLVFNILSHNQNRDILTPGYAKEYTDVINKVIC